jgi:hypothetical protein
MEMRALAINIDCVAAGASALEDGFAAHRIAGIGSQAAVRFLWGKRGESGFVGRCERRAPVNHAVLDGRHGPDARLVRYFLDKTRATIFGYLAPLGEIEMSAALDNIALNKPRGWREMGIRGPDCYVRMAGSAFGSKNDSGFFWNLSAVEQRATRLRLYKPWVAKGMQGRQRGGHAGEHQHRSETDDNFHAICSIV